MVVCDHVTSLVPMRQVVVDDRGPISTESFNLKGPGLSFDCQDVGVESGLRLAVGMIKKRRWTHHPDARSM